MKHSVNMRGGAANFLCVMAIASFAYALWSPFMASAQTTEPAPSPSSTPKPSAEEVVKRKAWHRNMYQTPTPRHGCFNSTYPSTEWQEVPCSTAPDRPYPLAVGSGFETVSGRSGFVARAAGSISTAVGFFDNATAAISESGSDGANSFSLQLNTNTFKTSSCTPPPPSTASPGCLGWQQFIFTNSGRGFIQYWLVGYFDNRSTCTSDCCPSDWNTFKPTASSPGAAGCWRNSAGTAPIPALTLTGAALVDLQLIGRATANTDTVTVATDGAHLYTASGQDSVLNLANNWQSAEFNIFGDCCGSQANFSSGSTMDVRIDVGGAATCSADGFTAEKNNLTVLKPCCTYTADGGGGGIMFTQSNAAGARSTCAGGPKCLPLGASCSFTGVGCCATSGGAECRSGRCARYVPPQSCNGHPRPTQACGLGWHCCDKWVCGQCQ